MKKTTVPAYRLRVSLPDAQIGDLYFFNGTAYSNYTRTALTLPKNFVEGMQSWFKKARFPVIK